MIICAALLLENKETKEQVVMPCFRHGNGFQMMQEFCLRDKWKVIEQGFITHENVFLNRTEAYADAILCGQLSAANKWYKEDNREVELYSEDLY